MLLPIYGMSSIADIFARVAQQQGWQETSDTYHEEHASAQPGKDEAITQWNDIMKKLHEPFEIVTGAMVEGLQHCMYSLELEKRPKAKAKGQKINDKNDVEAAAGSLRPGDLNFSKQLRARIEGFYGNRRATLGKTLAEEPSAGHEHSPLERIKRLRREDDDGKLNREHIIAHRQLFMILYVSQPCKHSIIPAANFHQMEYLLHSMSVAVIEFAEFADETVESGVMKRRRLINPGAKRLKKWFLSGIQSHDLSSTEQTPDSSEGGGAGVHVGASFGKRKDPEHLPPTSFYERFTDKFRIIASFLSSPASSFGVRAVLATMTIGITAFLAKTQHFYNEQRLLWALIMVAIGTLPHNTVLDDLTHNVLTFAQECQPLPAQASLGSWVGSPAL